MRKNKTSAIIAARVRHDAIRQIRAAATLSGVPIGTILRRIIEREAPVILAEATATERERAAQ